MTWRLTPTAFGPPTSASHRSALARWVWAGVLLAMLASITVWACVRDTSPKGQVVVSVRLLRSPGAPSADPLPLTALPYAPGVGVRVQVVPSTAWNIVVAQHTTDSRGEARFDLPPGMYWVFVPIDDPVLVKRGWADAETNMPSGRHVLGWTEVATPESGRTEVILPIVGDAP